MPTFKIDFDKLRGVFEPGSLPARSDLTIGTIINELLPYVFGAAGILLFIFLIIGGFGLMTSGGNPEKIELGKKRLTAALIGFVIIFVSYWLIQILETIFGITILGGT